MTELPKLSVKDRDGKASLWAGNLNIWDIPWNHATPEVLDAVASAYERGVEYAKTYIAISNHNMPTRYPVGHKWEIEGRVFFGRISEA